MGAELTGGRPIPGASGVQAQGIANLRPGIHETLLKGGRMKSEGLKRKRENLVSKRRTRHHGVKLRPKPQSQLKPGPRKFKVGVIAD